MSQKRLETSALMLMTISEDKQFLLAQKEKDARGSMVSVKIKFESDISDEYINYTLLPQKDSFIVLLYDKLNEFNLRNGYKELVQLLII